MIYLDHNATRSLRSEAKQAMIQAMNVVGNPSSVHGAGRSVRKVIEHARAQVAQMLGLEPRRIIFTSGATEANNIMLHHYPGEVIISATEHDSVSKVRQDAHICPVDANGNLDLRHLQSRLAALINKSSRPILVSIHWAHNETGVVQSIHEIVKLAKEYGAVVHVDAVQAVGRIKNLDLQLIDFLSFSGHKIGAATGVGVLVINPDIPIKPLTIGGGQERSYRAGTENHLSIASLPIALQVALAEDWAEIEALRNDLEKRILEISPKSFIAAKESNRLPNTTMFSMPGVNSETQVMHMDMHNICISAGSACSSGKVTLSRALKAMNVPEDLAKTCIRVSLSPDTTQEHIDVFLGAWEKLYRKNTPINDNTAANNGDKNEKTDLS